MYKEFQILKVKNRQRKVVVKERKVLIRKPKEKITK